MTIAIIIIAGLVVAFVGGALVLRNNKVTERKIEKAAKALKDIVK